MKRLCDNPDILSKAPNRMRLLAWAFRGQKTIDLSQLLELSEGELHDLLLENQTEFGLTTEINLSGNRFIRDYNFIRAIINA